MPRLLPRLRLSPHAELPHRGRRPGVQLLNDDDPRIAGVVPLPLIVNSMGRMKDLGTNLVRRIEDMAEPTDVFVEMDVYVEDRRATVAPDDR